MINKNIRQVTYDSLVPSESFLQSSSEFVSSKVEDIHKQAYDIAMSRWIEDHQEYKEGYNITEIRKKDFTEAPSILVASSKYPFTKKVFQLKDYWEGITFFKRKENQWINLQIDEEGVRDAEIVSIDYVNGKVKMESKMSGNNFDVQFNQVSKDTPLNDDKMGLTNTFTYLIGK